MSGVDRDHSAVWHRTAPDLQDSASRRQPLLNDRHLTIKNFEAASDFRSRLDLAEIAANRLTRQDLAERRARGQIGRQIEQLAKSAIARDQAAAIVEDAEAFPNALEGTLQQRAPTLELRFAAAQKGGCKLTASQGAHRKPRDSGGNH